ncbi:MAG: UDP-2,3-diacylglucosamine diphosphatase [Prolixibacteraceae bacterium]|nr:UDP-2,3-diacylglucosamine diphosphatase [Prolixibacteraceae bacterium]
MPKNITYFISDVHLGAPALNNNPERERLFVQWLDNAAKDAAAIYLLGDIFDFWYEYKKVAPRGFVRTLGKIAEITDKGIPVYFFTGNHDIWVYDYLPSETGVTVYHEPVVATIEGKKFFLGHGDGLDPNEKGYLVLKKFFTSKTAQFLYSRLHPNFAFWIGHKWAKHSRLAKGTDPEVSKGPDFETCVTFAKRHLEKEHIDYFLFGHRHVMMDEQLNEKSRLLILGEWINYFSYAVFDGKELKLKQFDKNL